MSQFRTLTDMPEFWLGVVLSILALGLGGTIKGATGAGVPIVAVPIMALFFDVQTAVIIMLLPSLVANILQGWKYRKHLAESGFSWRFAAAGAVGGFVGSLMLTNISPQVLLLMVAVVVVLYIGFRLARPGWRLPLTTARRIALPVGALAGTLQGATGVSAPVSITFLNATGLPRAGFVAVISLFFVASTTSQITVLASYDVLTLNGLMLSSGALAIILATMPIGEALAKRVSPTLFDRLILVLLTLVAARILLGALL